MPQSRAQSTERQGRDERQGHSRTTSREPSPRRRQRVEDGERARPARADLSPKRDTRSGQYGPLRPRHSSISPRRHGKRSGQDQSTHASSKPPASTEARKDYSALPKTSSSAERPRGHDEHDIGDDYGWSPPSRSDVPTEQNTSRRRSRRSQVERPMAAEEHSQLPEEDEAEDDDDEWPGSEFSDPPQWPEMPGRSRRPRSRSLLNSILRRSPPGFGGMIVCNVCKRQVSTTFHTPLRCVMLTGAEIFGAHYRCQRCSDFDLCYTCFHGSGPLFRHKHGKSHFAEWMAD